MIIKWRAYAPLLVTVLAGAAVLGLAWAYRRLPVLAAQNRSQSDMTKTNVVEDKLLPAIDAAAPAEVETATFAMG